VCSKLNRGVSPFQNIVSNFIGSKKWFPVFIGFWPFHFIFLFKTLYFLCLFICLSVCLSICVSLSVSICLSVCLSVCLPLSLSLSLPVSLSPLSLPSIRKSLLSVSLYHYLFLSIYLPKRNSLLLIGRLIFCWTLTFKNIDLRHQSDYSGSCLMWSLIMLPFSFWYQHL
jgi:hypothetical protein